MILFLGAGNFKKETFTHNFYMNLFLLLCNDDVAVCNYVFDFFHFRNEEVSYSTLDGVFKRVLVKYITKQDNVLAELHRLFFDLKQDVKVYVFNGFWVKYLEMLGIKYCLILDEYIEFDKKYCEKVFTFSDVLAKQYKKINVKVLNNFYDYENCLIADKKNQVVVVGDFFKSKNDVVRVLPILLEQNIDVFLVGDGDLFEDISRCVSNSHNVKFLYNIDFKEKLNLLAESRFVLLTDKVDGNFLWLNRALACGCFVYVIYSTIYQHKDFIREFDLEQPTFAEGDFSDVKFEQHRNLLFGDFAYAIKQEVL